MDLDKALVNAVHALANQKLKAAANTIKQAANANGARKNQLIQNLQRQLEEAKKAATTAEVVAPGVPATPDVQNAEVQAGNAVNKLINNIGQGVYNNRLKENPFANFSNVNGYNVAKKNNINRAAADRVLTFPH
jgi:orotidine-5'-phosphate decarboxylase